MNRYNYDSPGSAQMTLTHPDLNRNIEDWNIKDRNIEDRNIKLKIGILKIGILNIANSNIDENQRRLVRDLN